MNRMLSALRTPFAARGAAAFMGLSLATGVIVGLAAAGLIGAIEGIAEAVHWVRDEVGSDLVFLVSVPAGLLAAWAISVRFAPELSTVRRSNSGLRRTVSLPA